MEVYEAINSRRTVRDFQKRSVDRETIRKILTAGIPAPSNDHLRSWEFIVVDEPAARVRLLEKIPKRSTKKGIGSWLDSWGAVDPVQCVVHAPYLSRFWKRRVAKVRAARPIPAIAAASFHR